MKTTRILYWIVTSLLCLALTGIGISQLMPPTPEGLAVMQQIGYPLSVGPLLGVAKLLAVVALLQPWYRTVKEWAYAGLTFNLVGASYAFAVVGAEAFGVIFPLILLAVALASYFLWKRLQPTPVATTAPIAA